MHHLLTTAADLTEAGAGVIFRKDPSLDELSPIAYIGEAIHELHEHSIPLGSGVLGQAAASGQRQVINDLLSDPQLADDVLVYQGMRRVLTQPLQVADKTIGLIALFDERTQPFSAEDQDLVAMLAVQAATILAATGTVRLRAEPSAPDEGEAKEFVDLGSLLSD
jgi:GAF domain-containing protein